MQPLPGVFFPASQSSCHNLCSIGVPGPANAGPRWLFRLTVITTAFSSVLGSPKNRFRASLSSYHGELLSLAARSSSFAPGLSSVPLATNAYVMTFTSSFVMTVLQRLCTPRNLSISVASASAISPSVFFPITAAIWISACCSSCTRFRSRSKRITLGDGLSPVARVNDCVARKALFQTFVLAVFCPISASQNAVVSLILHSFSTHILHLRKWPWFIELSKPSPFRNDRRTVFSSYSSISSQPSGSLSCIARSSTYNSIVSSITSARTLLATTGAAFPAAVAHWSPYVVMPASAGAVPCS